MERHRFDEGLGSLRQRLHLMADLVQDRLARACRALFEGHAELARQVLGDDAEVNGLQIDIDDLCLRLLAQQQPVARDLRLITAIMKAATDLERVGDLAVNVAGNADLLARAGGAAPGPDLQSLAGKASRMLVDAVRAFVDGDTALARSVLARDDEVDDLRTLVFRQAIERMVASPGDIEKEMALILASRNLERVADHATNIAEDAVFLIEARDVRHHQQPS